MGDPRGSSLPRPELKNGSQVSCLAWKTKVSQELCLASTLSIDDCRKVYRTLTGTFPDDFWVRTCRVEGNQVIYALSASAHGTVCDGVGKRQIDPDVRKKLTSPNHRQPVERPNCATALLVISIDSRKSSGEYSSTRISCQPWGRSVIMSIAAIQPTIASTLTQVPSSW
jgi:hypothetical protein